MAIISINILKSQDKIVKPSLVRTPIYFDVSAPLSSIEAGDEDREEPKERNEGLRNRNYPFKATSLPRAEDDVWQKRMGRNILIKTRGLDKNFAGLNVNSMPSDCNGTIGPNHYMQTVNAYYEIYDRDGNKITGAKMNTLFEGVAGSDNNDGDPIIMYDQQAGRWLAAEFSGVNSNPDYMMIAVSETNDPTGSWYRWSWETNGFPDYMKFGIWQDGYYMGVNANGNNEDDIYVFERSKMINGEADPKMVAFDNPNRPNSGFHVVLPMDNDGDFAPSGTPGQFITINDDAWGNGDDALWVFELRVDWANTSNSTFQRTQVISVSPFDSDFGSNLENIKQKGTSQKVDAIPQVLMHRAQYRNFGDHQTVVCNHTVDVDDSDHAGIRWYELENTGSGWSIRQQGTYAPDAHSRWMASIAMNGNKDIGVGYSVSSSNLYPSIRFAGQSATENANATGVFDIAETSIKEGTHSQTNADRWGDYSNMSIDPTDDNAFWFTTEYVGDDTPKSTRIVSFSFAPPPLNADFVADNTSVCSDEVVSFTDKSTGNPTSWNWDITDAVYVNGTSSSSQNPEVKFNNTGSYDVTLMISDGAETDTETKSGYITVHNIISDFTASQTNISEGESVTFTDDSQCNPTSWEWTFDGGEPSTYSGQTPPEIRYYNSGTYTVSLTVSNANGDDTEIKSSYIVVDSPDILMSDGQKNTCSANFYDSGGANDDYSDDEDFVLTIAPADNTKRMQVEFSDFNIESSSNCSKDYLEIYDGDDTNAPLIGKYCGTDSPGTVAASGSGGKLTFHFVSDNPFFSNSTEAGWVSKCSCIETSLPLDIVDFKGKVTADKNVLSWITVNENNLEKFVLEKSFNGIDYMPVSELLNSSKPDKRLKHYLIEDNSPYRLTYYRIKAIAIDGKYKISNTISLERESKLDFGITSIYPNPSKDNISVEFSQKKSTSGIVSVFIYSITGKLMKMRKYSLDEGQSLVDVNLKMLPKGEYILKLICDAEIDVKKIVKE